LNDTVFIYFFTHTKHENTQYGKMRNF